jgi:outer membrane protein OmpA-like peptidoglycan-associated protein
VRVRKASITFVIFCGNLKTITFIRNRKPTSVLDRHIAAGFVTEKMRSTAMKKFPVFVSVLLLAACAWAQQDAAPAQADQAQTPAQSAAPASQGQDATKVEPMDQTPVFRVNVVSRTTKAVNYRHRGGSTMVDFKGTDLMPLAKGKAKVDSKSGRLQINAELERMMPATKFGSEYLTYVLWAITPEGRPLNLGEVLLDNGKAKLEVTTDLQAFGMIVTAEPYFAVTYPSNLVVVENMIKYQTKGWEEPINAKFDMLEGGQYTIDVKAADLPASNAAPNTPLELLEARNAVAIAKAAGAEQYAGDSMSKAEDFLARAEDYLKRKQGLTPIGTVARGATEMSEDARVLTLKLKEQERVAAEKRALQEKTAKAQAEAQAEAERAAKAKADAEEQQRLRQQAEADRLAAEKAKAEADQMRQEAETARAAALAAQQQAQADAEKARQAADEAIRQKEEVRQRLLSQLNQVLETKDTPRGLVVSMPDVLFATNRYNLKEAARESLARIAGIILAYPDLRLEIEGHTDSTGTEEYNQVLSEKRAGTVRDYLVDKGVDINTVVAHGLGESDPVAANDTAAGRKLNRRVELIVSGEVIGTKIGANAQTVSAPNAQPPAPQAQAPAAAVPQQ